MPTVLRFNGFTFIIRTHDHLPRHVHVFNGDGSVIIAIETLDVRDRYGMKNRAVNRARQVVADNADFLMAEWDRIGPIP